MPFQISYRAVFFFSALVLFGRCSDADQRVTAEAPVLTGQWVWVESVGGMMPNPTPHTPTTEGYTETLVFEQGGAFRRLRDGEVVETKTYRLQTDTIAGQVEYALVLADQTPRTLRFPAVDTLVIDERAYDGPASTYVRGASDEDRK